MNKLFMVNSKNANLELIGLTL